MAEAETLFFLLTAVTAFVLLSRRLAQPYPILLVLGGLALGFVPGLPQIEMRSEIVLLLFLPPLLFFDALHTSWTDFRNNLRPILLLAIGLVLLTMLAVAAVAHALIPDLPWPAAFVLGAVVAPTDAVATGAIAESIHLPRRVTVILQGESLVNDATAIVAYRIALGVVDGGHFSVGGAAGSFSLVAAGGVAIGLAVGYIIGLIRRKLPQDAPVENTISLLTPLAAYLPAEALHVSGVLAVVVCGIYLGRVGSRIISSSTRLQSNIMWQMVTFLLNGLLFLIVGLQLNHIVGGLTPHDPIGLLIIAALLISLTVIVVRIAWVFASTCLPRLIPAFRALEPTPNWRNVAVVAWSGLRGGISLAVAIAIPETLTGTAGTPFPARNAILFVTFCVILVTLVAQGMSLPPLIRALGVVGGDQDRVEELSARSQALAAALERLEELSRTRTISPNVYTEIKRLYEMRSRHIEERKAAGAALDPPEEHGASADSGKEAPPATYLSVKQELTDAERAVIIALRDSGEITDSVMRRIQQDLDMDTVRNGRQTI